MTKRQVSLLVAEAHRLWRDEPWQDRSPPQPGFSVGLKQKPRFNEVISELWEGNGGPLSIADIEGMFPRV